MTVEMITIRKKLAEQAATKQEREDRTSGGKEIKRRQSFRTQLLTSGSYIISSNKIMTNLFKK
jgi:hypothetical protein